LPWIPIDALCRLDNFAALTSLDWQVRVYGAALPEMRAYCAAGHLALHEFAWQQPAMERAGFQRSGLYLLRPDGHVAWAAADQSASALSAYLGA
jgi:Aromatic-ring hydroxylase, C-terminal